MPRRRAHCPAARFNCGPDKATPEVPTAVPLPKLRELLRATSVVPADFTPHEKIVRLLADRRKLAEPDPIDTVVGCGYRLP